MKRTPIYLIAIVIISFCFSCSNQAQEEFSERVKIALRSVGNELLLSNADSTSLVLPVSEVKRSKYRLSFEANLSIEPSELTSEVQLNFQKSDLPQHYRVEVLPCNSDEVVYSYQMSEADENTLIPCGGRVLPKGCYYVDVRFTKNITSKAETSPVFYYIISGVFIVLLVLIYRLNKRKNKTEVSDKEYIKIGSFQFYSTQNKLIKEATEISLSKKECELLEIFVANLNQVVKRDELTKRVWEDNGVFVGRSLDTYVSKLRKKLKDDTDIKLTNVHGVGYKLEIDKE